MSKPHYTCKILQQLQNRAARIITKNFGQNANIFLNVIAHKIYKVYLSGIASDTVSDITLSDMCIIDKLLPFCVAEKCQYGPTNTSFIVGIFSFNVGSR